MIRSALLALSLVLLAGGASAQDQLRQACRADAQRLCGDVRPGGGRVGACMRAHEQELSEACRSAIAEARAARAKRS